MNRPTFRTLLAATALCILAAPGGAQEHAPGTLDDPAAWRNEIPAQPETLLVRGATVWTQGPQGTLVADLLVRRGEIVAVGPDLAAPAGAQVVEAAGLHVTPGIIDAHSHTAIDGSVNEGTSIVTAEVGIADVIDSEDVNIYRQLAGGVTAANLLHGSANAIGGRNAVIKMRWGATPEGLLFAEAPPGIKFALGENPKQSNWNADEQRFPQTRAGVEEVLRQTFQQAANYRRAQEEHRARVRREPNLVPPRRDLRLEAVLEILDGRRDVHAHSYRADEILMLLRVAEEHGFRIKAFQHVLEGYKVADEIAAHGAGASTFSDWWAFKYEVIDAIPYNGAIMHDRGVVVSFNSDSSELARRLNLEAAKAVRYGGVAEEQALAFVTSNPARQLGVDHLVGSLEPGKHADFAIWSGHPLSFLSTVEQTWVDGRPYFDRQRARGRMAAIAAERAALIAKVRTAGQEEDAGAGEEPAEPEVGDSPPEARSEEEWR